MLCGHIFRADATLQSLPPFYSILHHIISYYYLGRVGPTPTATSRLPTLVVLLSEPGDTTQLVTRNLNLLTSPEMSTE